MVALYWAERENERELLGIVPAYPDAEVPSPRQALFPVNFCLYPVHLALLVPVTLLSLWRLLLCNPIVGCPSPPITPFSYYWRGLMAPFVD